MIIDKRGEFYSMTRRNTNQKQIVYDALECLGHADTEKLIAYINEHYDGISLATIYRNLTSLQEDNKIARRKLGNMDVYETVKGKHYHLKCKICGEIYDIDANDVSVNLDVNKDGNEIDDVDVIFYGVCHNCKVSNN